MTLAMWRHLAAPATALITCDLRRPRCKAQIILQSRPRTCVAAPAAVRPLSPGTGGQLMAGSLPQRSTECPAAGAHEHRDRHQRGAVRAQAMQDFPAGALRQGGHRTRARLGDQRAPRRALQRRAHQLRAHRRAMLRRRPRAPRARLRGAPRLQPRRRGRCRGRCRRARVRRRRSRRESVKPRHGVFVAAVVVARRAIAACGAVGEPPAVPRRARGRSALRPGPRV